MVVEERDYPRGDIFGGDSICVDVKLTVLASVRKSAVLFVQHMLSPARSAAPANRMKRRIKVDKEIGVR